MKKWILILMIAGTLTAVAGCSKSEDNRSAATTEAVTAEAGNEAASSAAQKQGGETGFVVLPAYQYSGDDVYMQTMLDKLMEDKGSKIKQADVTIPDIVEVKVEDDDPQNIKIWNYARVFSFKKKGTELKAVDGAEVLGLIHMKETVNGYEITGWDQAAYGDDAKMLKSIRKICNNDWDLTYGMVSAYRDSDLYHTAIIRMYVEANQLDIDRYSIGDKTLYLSDITTIEDGNENGFEGTYIQKEDDSSLEIHSLGNGSFSVKMALVQQADLSGTGEMDGDVLNFTLTSGDKGSVSCVAVRENDMVTVSVVKSDLEKIPLGESFEFYSAADVSTEPGAPSTAEAIE